LRRFLHDRTSYQELKLSQNFRAFIGVFRPVPIVLILVSNHVFVEDDELLITNPRQVVDLSDRFKLRRLVVQDCLRHHRSEETCLLLDLLVEEAVAVDAKNTRCVFTLTVDFVYPELLQHRA